MYVHKQLIIPIPHDEFDFIFHQDFCNLYVQCTVDIELVDACAMYKCLDIPVYYHYRKHAKVVSKRVL